MMRHRDEPRFVVDHVATARPRFGAERAQLGDQRAEPMLADQRRESLALVIG
jgi:hypothetical protein